ncbi:hypothetical protein JYU14_04940 [Simkania negevensis]|uniref:Uncharacterized protein n=1 Tax=Simkania negevensis TaxID=83561 RepID=A0ABS3ASV2_9BACT|nr:hypothetical protein [Simkania negevensis]
MKKILSLLLLLSVSTVFGTPLQDYKLDPVAVRELAAFMEIPEDEDIIVETQKRWLRPSDKERWELAELPLEKKEFVIAWAKKQGMFDRCNPGDCRYETAVILGSSTSRMTSALNYLKRIWGEGIHFNELLWLTGDRPLDARIDDMADRCDTESEAARLIWEEATDCPEKMGSLPVVFVSAPMKEEDGVVKRPSREDAVNAWLKTNPKPCRALVVSGQPFCGYDLAVLKTHLPQSFLYDVVGLEADPNSHPAAAAIILDNVARWLYQDHVRESQLREKAAA